MKHGFGSYPPSRKFVTLSETDFSLVKNVYLSDDIIRLMPGQKYCVSVKQTDGKSVKIQKRLILCNLKEAYVHFKTLYPHMKLRFTKFSV